MSFASIVVVGSGILVLGYAIYRIQLALLYLRDFPSGSRSSVAVPGALGLDYDDITLRTSDGESLHAYFIYSQKNVARKKENEEEEGVEPATVIYFHANAGNMGHRLPVAKSFSVRLGCHVLMVSYRGYGKSTGEPCETGIKEDAKAALQFVVGNRPGTSRPPVGKSKVIVYGQSLGGAVAIDTAARFPDLVDALIVENTFLSVPDMATSIFMPARLRKLTNNAPLLPWLFHERWASKNQIKTLSPSIPVLFLSSEKDELVPPFHMQRLFDFASKSHPNMETATRKMVKFPLGTHNDATFQAGYFEAIHAFMKNEKLLEPFSNTDQ